MRRLILPVLLAVLAMPAAALAAPAKITGPAAAVSADGLVAVKAANPNRHALSGKATLAVGGRTVATKAVRLAKRSAKTITLRLDADGLAALRAAGGRATLTLALRRGGKKTTARKALTLSLPGNGGPGAPANDPVQPSSGPATGQATSGSQTGGTTTGSTTGTGSGSTGTPGTDPTGPTEELPPSNDWVGRMGTEGDYDDFGFTLVDGRIELTKPALVPVYCFENGGYSAARSRSRSSTPRARGRSGPTRTSRSRASPSTSSSAAASGRSPTRSPRPRRPTAR